MQVRSCIGTQPNNISGIGGDFRFKQTHGEHGGTIRGFQWKRKRAQFVPLVTESSAKKRVLIPRLSGILESGGLHMHQHPISDHIIPRTSDLGQMQVKRALPSVGKRAVGPFVFWDQMGPGELLTDQGIDVRPHPHIGLATLTYLFEGQIEHRDSLGIRQLITPGAINLMTAGSGIVHSERSDAASRASVSPLFGLQSWLALPQSHEECSPDFLHVPEAALPRFD